MTPQWWATTSHKEKWNTQSTVIVGKFGRKGIVIQIRRRSKELMHTFGKEEQNYLDGIIWDAFKVILSSEKNVCLLHHLYYYSSRNVLFSLTFWVHAEREQWLLVLQWIFFILWWCLLCQGANLGLVKKIFFCCWLLHSLHTAAASHENINSQMFSKNHFSLPFSQVIRTSYLEYWDTEEQQSMLRIWFITVHLQY